MSRIGKQPVLLPSGVEATVADGVVTVKGPKGTLTVPLPKNVSAAVQAEPRSLAVTVANPDRTEEKALWGLARQLVANAVRGVQTPYEKSLEFVGVGFKVALTGDVLKMDVGLSHSVSFKLPAGIAGKVDKQVLTLTGIDKQLVGETAAQIRRVKPPEPYKGKGVKYVDEVIRRKAGKAAAKGA